MAGFRIEGDTSGNVLEVDSNNNAKVNLPVVPAQAGFSQFTYNRDASTSRVQRITEEGEAYGAVSRMLFYSPFNNAVASGTAPMSAQWCAQATTMTGGVTAGFFRLNLGAVTTVSTGYAMQTWRQFSVEDGSILRGKFHLRHTNASVANKQIDVGFGFYGPAAGQSAAMNEFAGFRWTTAGALIGVLEYSTGAGPTSLTVNINGGVPLSDNVSREYEIILGDNGVEFWINNIYQASIAYAADSPGVLKASGYPAIIRLFNTASLPAAAPILDVGDVSIIRVGFEADVPVSYRQALMGRHCIYAQPGVTATDGQTALVPASGTAPTAATGSNTATTFTGLGGFYRLNGAAITVTAHSNVLVSSYQNPALPTAAGAGNDVRNLVITDIFVNPIMVSAALTTQTGAINIQWFVAIGGSAVSLATTTAIGTTTPGTKAPRIIPLPMNDSFASAPAAGTVGTRVGQSQITLGTPLVINPGEFFQLGFRVLVAPTAAATAGTYDGSVGVSGYWD